MQVASHNQTRALGIFYRLGSAETRVANPGARDFTEMRRIAMLRNEGHAFSVIMHTTVPMEMNWGIN